jgi:hypothetical protein
MRDVEELLRETLTDQRRRLTPSPDLYDAVRGRARARRRARLATGLAAVAVVVVVGAASAAALRPVPDNETSRIRPATASPSVTAATNRVAVGTVGDTVGGVGSGAQAVASSGGEIWAIFSDVTGNASTLWPVAGTAPGDTKVAAPAGNEPGVAIDSVDHLVWAWASQGNSGSVTRYDIDADATSTGVSWDSGQIFAAAALDGSLWVATDTGLYRIDSTNDMLVSPIPSETGQVFSVTADPAHNSVLVGEMDDTAGSSAGTRLVSINAATGALVKGTPLGIGKETIAIVDNEVWVAGYGDVDKPRIIHLDPTTLNPIGTSAVDARVGPGSQVWSGQHVVWARDGGDEQLACLDPATGDVLEAWTQDVQGPVTSIAGHVYAVSNGSLEELNLAGGCTG